MSLNRLIRTFLNAEPRTYDPTLPTTAELSAGVGPASDEAARAVVWVSKMLDRFAALADDLDYYASKTNGNEFSDGFAEGYRSAAWKIRRVIEGHDPHDDTQDEL
jgi:hypothetical protein